jgi:hypothetical protein
MITEMAADNSVWKRFAVLEARMPHEKTIGKPDAENPHV